MSTETDLLEEITGLQAYIHKLENLLTEFISELEIHIDQEHKDRDVYPFIMRRYKRDMGIIVAAKNLLGYEQTDEPKVPKDELLLNRIGNQRNHILKELSSAQIQAMEDIQTVHSRAGTLLKDIHRNIVRGPERIDECTAALQNLDAMAEHAYKAIVGKLTFRIMKNIVADTMKITGRIDGT